MTTLITSAAISLILALAAAPEMPQGPEGNVDKGRTLAADRCGLCHATGPKGASPLAKAPPFRTINQKYDVEGLAESLAEGIGVGDPRMPAHILKPDEIADLLAYIKGLPAPGH